MQTGEVLIYQTAEGEPVIDVVLQQQTLWLTQRLMSELFDKNSDTIGLHVKNIYSEGELDESTTREILGSSKRRQQRG